VNQIHPEIQKYLSVEPKKPLLPELSQQAELAILARTLFREGYNDHIAGHISFLQDDGTILINPWELAWDELQASDIIRVDRDHNVVEGNWNVTPAVNLHFEVYDTRPDVKVVMHNHSQWGSVWAGAKRVPPLYDQSSAQVDGELVLFDEFGGTVNEGGDAASAVAGMGDAKYALLAHHGVMVVAKDCYQMHLRAVTLEWRCKVAYHVEALGGKEAMSDAAANSVGGKIDRRGFPFLWEAMARREIRLDPTVLD